MIRYLTAGESHGEALIGVNIIVVGTSTGAATDLDGEYRLTRVPAGEQVLIVSFVGYRQQRLPITVPAGGEREVDVALELDIIEGEEVVVTGQASGQVSAINIQARIVAEVKITLISKID